jgi:hypothetical protein
MIVPAVAIAIVACRYWHRNDAHGCLSLAGVQSRLTYRRECRSSIKADTIDKFSRRDG